MTRLGTRLIDLAVASASQHENMRSAGDSLGVNADVADNAAH